jgi:hypothetical protein
MISYISNNNIKNYIPDVCPTTITGEPDYYGATKIIASICRKKEIATYTPKTWLHGWNYVKPLKFIRQIILWGHENNVHLVHTNQQKNFALDMGYRFTEAIGSPFVYVEKSQNKRIPNSILIMPQHSLAQAENKIFPHNYLDYISNIKNKFGLVVVCLHHHDAQKSEWPDKLKKLNIHWITGACVDDSNSLYRMRSIFDSFEYMTTNTLGSHVPYAALSGCKVSIDGPFNKLDPAIFDNDPWYNNKKELLDYKLNFHNENYGRLLYSHLYICPDDSCQSIDWASKELGEENKKNPKELIKIFGWSKSARIWGYMLGKKQNRKR